jgi:hypothetical protein
VRLSDAVGVMTGALAPDAVPAARG